MVKSSSLIFSALGLLGIGLAGAYAYFKWIKPLTSVQQQVSTAGSDLGFIGSGGGIVQTSQPAPVNTYEQPQPLGIGKPETIEISQHIPTYKEIQSQNLKTIDSPTLPKDAYVSKPPYSIPTFLAIGKAQGVEPPALIKGKSGGYLSIVAEGSGQEVQNTLLIRGRTLNNALATHPDVIVGLVSTSVGGTREIVGTPRVWERLAENLGVSGHIQ